MTNPDDLVKLTKKILINRIKTLEDKVKKLENKFDDEIIKLTSLYQKIRYEKLKLEEEELKISKNNYLHLFNRLSKIEWKLNDKSK